MGQRVKDRWKREDRPPKAGKLLSEEGRKTRGRKSGVGKNKKMGRSEIRKRKEERPAAVGGPGTSFPQGWRQRTMDDGGQTTDDERKTRALMFLPLA
jgi:hypothetical protein